MASDPRRAALDILVRLDASAATLDRLMESFHAAAAFSRRDARFVNALVFGVQRWRYRLDMVLRRLSTQPPRKADPRVVNILRLGLFQIMEMDRVPEAAVVHTSVELTRDADCPWAAGYINAVLRRALREPHTLASPEVTDDPIQYLAAVHSFPPWMVARWLERFGRDEVEALCRTINRIPPLVLRTNLLRTTTAELAEALKPQAPEIRPSTYVPAALLIDRMDAGLFESAPYASGWFQVQDEAAQAVGYLLDARPGEMVLDACAGLGGKTAHLAECMQNRGRITAVDQDRRKLDRLETEMRRLGIAIVHTRSLNWLKSDQASLPTKRFAKILLDAPCSGMGVLRRNPDAKWKRRAKDFKRYQAVQRRLLAALAPLLDAGGVLVYAVCSTELEETQGVLRWFLKNHPQFAIDRPPSSLPPAMKALITPDGCLWTEVHRQGTDGFFAVRLKRRN